MIPRDGTATISCGGQCSQALPIHITLLEEIGMNRIQHIAVCFVLLTMSGSLAVGEEIEDAGIQHVLDARGKAVQRLEVSSAFGGYRDTLIFYTFADQHAVLKVVIDNKDKAFPVSGTIYAFADDVSEEDLKKWLNNQHSDGLFVDVPKPVATHKIPADAGKTLSRKFLKHTQQREREYDDYSVIFQLAEVKKLGEFRVKKFTDKATVHLPTK